MAKQLLTTLRLIARMNFSLKNHSYELFNLTGMVGKVELIPTFRERSLIMAGRRLEGKLKIFNKMSQPIQILQDDFVAH